MDAGRGERGNALPACSLAHSSSMSSTKLLSAAALAAATSELGSSSSGTREKTTKVPMGSQRKPITSSSMRKSCPGTKCGWRKPRAAMRPSP